MTVAYVVLLVTVLGGVAANPAVIVPGTPGSEVRENPNDLAYKEMALEAFSQYEAAHKIFSTETGITVLDVTSQVVNGKLYRLRYQATTSSVYGLANSYECFSEVWKKPSNQNEITGDCFHIYDIISPRHKKQRKMKREAVGARVVQNPSESKYDELARESLQKYIKTHPDIRPLSLVVLTATSQVVSGTLIRLDFFVYTAAAEGLLCQSEILEQPWLKKKDITVDC